MNTNQLEYFIAVAENLNFTQAARQCFISQTAMSLQIQSLEQNLGVQLFHRDKHHVALTSAGEIYLKEARDILFRLDEARKLAHIAQEGLAGSLTIGFIRGYEQSDISTPLRSFHENYPNISIHFIRNNMSSLYEQLELGECDVAFTLLPYSGITPDDLNIHFLRPMPLNIVLYPGHPKANKKACQYYELADENFIIMQPEGRPREETEEALLCLDRGGFIPNIIRWEREIQTILMSVSIGLGIAVIPEYTVQFYKNAPNLRIVPLIKQDGTPETLDFGLCWRKDNKNPALEKFLEWMR